MQTMTDAQRFYSQPAPRPVTRQNMLEQAARVLLATGEGTSHQGVLTSSTA
jgi:hypothetical protein